MNLKNLIVTAVCSLVLPVTSFAKADSGVCEQIWGVDDAFIKVRRVAYRILELHPYAVLETQNLIRKYHPSHADVDPVDVYDGLHRILWEELLVRHRLALPSPRVQKTMLEHAMRRVSQVWGRN